MASPTDPNKQKMTDSIAIEKMQPTFGLTKGQFAQAYDGQKVGDFTIRVSGKKITAIEADDPEA